MFKKILAFLFVIFIVLVGLNKAGLIEYDIIYEIKTSGVIVGFVDTLDDMGMNFKGTGYVEGTLEDQAGLGDDESEDEF